MAFTAMAQKDAASLQWSHGLALNVRLALVMLGLLGLGACSALPGSGKPDLLYSGAGEAGDEASKGAPQSFPQLSDVPNKRPEVTSQPARDVLAKQLEIQRARNLADAKALQADPTGSINPASPQAPAAPGPQSSLAPAAKTQVADAIIPMPPAGGHATLDGIDPRLAQEIASLAAQRKAEPERAAARSPQQAVARMDPEPVVKAAPTARVSVASLSQ